MFPEFNIFKDRSLMLNKVRSFFLAKEYIEVDPPHITNYPSIDAHIEVIEALIDKNKLGYLHTSPEYMMKRLLSLGFKEIFFLGHVFRNNEMGRNHNLEFTMLEWYNTKTGFSLFLDEIAAVINLFFNFKEIKKYTYKEIFKQVLNIDPFHISIKDLKEKAKKEKINFTLSQINDKDTLLNLLMSSSIEKNLTGDALYFIYDFPASLAALAKIHLEENEEVAERFEVYYQTLELGNGFHELQNAEEQRKRLLLANEKREKKLPIDEHFLSALKKGIPDCYGMALGFDRLLMLRHRQKNIANVLYFSFDKA